MNACVDCTATPALGGCLYEFRVQRDADLSTSRFR